MALSANRETARKEGGLKSYLVEDNVHIYKGGMVVVNASGYAIPAADTAGYKFVGIAYEECDNSLTGHSQGGKSVRVYTQGLFLLAATSITIAMLGAVMYVKDDQTFDDTSTNLVPCGKLVEYVSTSLGWIDISPSLAVMTDPANPFLNMTTKTNDYTVLTGDSGTTFAIATDAKVFTLPATAAGLRYTFVNTGADAAVLLSVSPNASDKITGGGITGGADNKDYQNTKATAKKYDYLTIVGDGADGWMVTARVGTWVAES